MVEIEVTIGGTKFKLERMGDFADEPHALWDEIQEDQITKSQLTFRKLRKGGTYRGVTWEPFRRTPSRRRGGASANLLRDTGRLSSAVATRRYVIGNEIRLITPVEYAGFHQDTPIGSGGRRASTIPERPFTFFTDADLDYYSRFIAERLTQAFRRR